MVQIMLGYVAVQNYFDDSFGKESIISYVPAAAYSLVPVLASKVFSRIVDYLEHFEEHTSKVEKEIHVVAKKFIFEFVNRYCALLYFAVFLRDLYPLNRLLICVMIFCPIAENLSALFVSNATKNSESSHNGHHHLKVLEAELAKAIYEVDDDIMQIILQYGYVVMFSTVAPITPFIALLNSIFEGNLTIGNKLHIFHISH